MKETVQSLRAYLGLIGLLGILSNLGKLYLYLSLETADLVGILLTLIGVGLSGTFLYLSFHLKRLLINSPEFVSKIIWVTAGFQIISFIFNIWGDNGIPGVFQPIFGLIICGYLLTNINRLSRSLQEEIAQSPSENKTDK